MHKKESAEYSVVEEKLLDLNLELRISPPWQDQLHDEMSMRFRREKHLCTACRFGLGNGKECSCYNVRCQTEDSSSSSYSSSDISSSIGYDFLGVNTRVLDFSSLEMKWNILLRKLIAVNCDIKLLTNSFIVLKFSPNVSSNIYIYPHIWSSNVKMWTFWRFFKCRMLGCSVMLTWQDKTYIYI